jgi:predicted DNA-binding transcriptional regulator AlpA
MPLVSLEPEYLTTQEVAQMTRIPVKTLEGYRRHGMGPPYVKIGRGIRYPISGVREWMKNGGKLDPPEE